MRRLNRFAAFAAAFCCALLSVQTQASEAADKINAEVERRAVEIDHKYGVLMDYQERGDLKLDLIAEKQVSENNTDKTVQVLAEEAIAAYEITDPAEQRRLLIKIETQVAKSTGAGGTEPCNVNPDNC